MLEYCQHCSSHFSSGQSDFTTYLVLTKQQLKTRIDNIYSTLLVFYCHIRQTKTKLEYIGKPQTGNIWNFCLKKRLNNHLIYKKNDSVVYVS